MFSIYGGATVFEQWAMDYALTNEHMKSGDVVIFHASSGATKVMYAFDEGGTVMVNVPNRLLQSPGNLVVDLEGFPGCRTIINVNPNAKPDGYDAIFTEADSHAPGDLKTRVAALEESGGSGGGSAGGGRFVVNLTWVDLGYAEAISADKTYAEIKAAIDAGMTVVVNSNGLLFVHNGTQGENGPVLFSNTRTYNSAVSGSPVYMLDTMMLTIDSDNNATITGTTINLGDNGWEVSSLPN